MTARDQVVLDQYAAHCRDLAGQFDVDLTDENLRRFFDVLSGQIIGITQFRSDDNQCAWDVWTFVSAWMRCVKERL